MAFFLETLIGGLMAGMLYSLVALGFVLIYKASGVFNFAQGAMVLFAALAMARFAEWIPQWTGIDNAIVANLAAFVIAGGCMFVVAWLIERLALRHLVNQEGATLLMATLGIAYFLEGLGQTLFGSDIYKIDIGMPKDPIFMFDSIFSGGVMVNQEDVIAAAIAAALVAQPHLGHRLVRGWRGGFGGRHDLGLQTGCAVFFDHGCTARFAGGDFGWPDLGARRHYWRPDHRCRREAVRGVFGSVRGWWH